MKNKKRIISNIFIIFIIMLIFQSNIILAVNTIDTDVEIGKTNAIHSSESMIKKLVGSLQAVGTVVSVIALVIIGLRYMFSSLEEKAEMKGVIGYYILGAVLVFATSNILSVVYNVIFNIKY